MKVKLIRRRKPSIKTILGITKVKRRIAKATGIPTTRSGRKRKALNILTGGMYGKYIRARAAVLRPFKIIKNPPSCMGCMIYVIGTMSMIAALIGWIMLL